MYESRFGLRARPFRPVPDPDRYYPATGHEEALGRLRQALIDEEGLCLLSGEPGTGKTLLCHCLLRQRDEASRSAFLTNGHLPDRLALLQAILFELSLPHAGLSEQEARLALTEDLLAHGSQGSATLLLVDEAHHLSPDVLEELRLLANLEGGQGRALQIVLVAQPSILQTLRLPGMGSLRQRLSVRATLEPLGAAEAADYMLHQLRSVGGSAHLISGEALEILATATAGVPRLLNQAAHRALCLACSAGAEAVDAEAALEALAWLGLDSPPADSDSLSERTELKQLAKSA